MKLHRLVLVLLCCSLAFSVLFVACSDDDDDDDVVTPTEKTEIAIGVLSPESGAYPSGGVMMNTAVELAVEDLNQAFEDDGENYEVVLYSGDTETTADGASALFRTFVNNFDVDIFLGPMTSTEVEAVAGEDCISDALVLSPSSTSPTMALPDDNIYRLVTGDNMMADALADVMWENGVRVLYNIYAPDSWGDSLSQLVGAAFEAKGGDYLGRIYYMPYRSTSIAEAVDSAKAAFSGVNATPEQCAIQLTCFEDGAAFFPIAVEDDFLSQVQWYGSDGLALNSNVLEWAEACSCAIELGFMAPLYGVTETTETAAFTDRFIEAVGVEPDAYAMLSYDAMCMAVHAKFNAGEDASISTLRTALETEAASMNGLTGAMTLDANGDRDSGAYFFWTLVEEGGEYVWQHTCTYNDGTITEE